MLKNFFKVAFRNMARNKAHSFINITGLSVGMAVAMLIGFWVYDELSFNTFFDSHDRIAVVVRNFNYNSQRISLPGYCPYQLREELLNKYAADFRSVVLSTGTGDHLIANSNTNFQKKGSFMDAGAADMLSLRMLKGSRAGLQQPSGLLLSASVAATIFGNADPLGRTLQIDGQSNAVVTGVYEDIPYNTDFKDLGFIASLQLFITANPIIKTSKSPWMDASFFTAYVQVTDRADMSSVSLKIKNILLGELPDGEYKIEQPYMFLQPMDKWHLYADFENYTGYKVREKIEYVRLMGVIGIFVLLLACINFINLSTARSEKRAKEVGVRKTIGSLRTQLIGQFLFESLLAVGFAFLLSLLWVVLALPSFNRIADKHIAIPWGVPFFWIACVLFGLLTGLISGLYPALYLSSFEPVKVLKGTFRLGPLAAIPRKILVVFQFTVSVGLIICTTVIYRQIQFAFDRP
ncbi:MAG TPA: ABC transporter permease, partial [Puia sp.]|nr:ABC transporter permease [Puia sp.]